MAISIDTLEQLLKDAFPGAVVEITDLVGDGDHYSAHIEHASFANLSRIDQHRLVHDALGSRVGTQVHALSLQTTAPTKS